MKIYTQKNREIKIKNRRSIKINGPCDRKKAHATLCSVTVELSAGHDGLAFANGRSCAAVEKFGAKKEGVLRKHKGSSILMFHPDCKATTCHTYLEWMGGMYVTPSINGSRSGADVAVTWATLLSKGREGYIAATKKILELKNQLVKEVYAIDGFHMPYVSPLSVIGIQGDAKVNALLIADQLKMKGWSVNLLQTADQKPAGFHFF